MHLHAKRTREWVSGTSFIVMTHAAVLSRDRLLAFSLQVHAGGAQPLWSPCPLRRNSIELPASMQRHNMQASSDTIVASLKAYLGGSRPQADHNVADP